ncbi:BglG family transcription antiterminator [Clostridium intestinale]|uniref:BglG family transcription antiterminator n=1 Tax=Clostridium intestinale TaxID=36845 RepID=A0A7D6VXH8_9CLOT|nr:BglG family transcription antiterminator [Clostridium intestinale]QLY78011.1 BglG family transcription antiterminator [Clostridium intestinale]
MKNIKITLRQKNILQDLCNSSDYITISSIAKHLEISSRTVIRELDEIEKWLKYYGLSLDKKTRFGIRIHGDEDDRGFIADMLKEAQGRNVYSPEERQKTIIMELLKNQDPVKVYNFSNMLSVTEATISSDLDKVEEWLRNNKIKLIRKSGIGVYVEGSEKLIRKAIIKIIYENVNEDELLSFVNGILSEKDRNLESKEDRTNSRLLYLIDKNTISKLEKLIYDLEKKIECKFTDNAYIGFIVHLALAIERIKKDEKIIMDKNFLDDLKKYPEFIVAEELAKDLGEIFDINIPKDEIGYITMHIKGTKNLESGRKSNILGNFELVKISQQIIRIAQEETGTFLQNDERLLSGLVNHIGPTINRIKLGMDIRNPLLEEIKEHYPHLMTLGKKSLKGLENYLGIEIPESEIAYIAMHLGAVLEKKEIAVKKSFTTVVACATGIGTSGLLASRIEKEYENIEIIDVISIIHLDEKLLEEKGIDFIISTIPITNINIPVVVVNPLLFKEDMDRINNFIMTYKEVDKKNTIKKDASIGFKEKIIKLQYFLDAVIGILDNFFVRDYERFDNIEGIILEASKIAAKSANEEEVIYKALKEREKMSSTVITGKKFVLVHSSVPIPTYTFGVIRLKSGLSCKNGNGDEETINMAVIMILSSNHSKEYMEVMSYISRTIIDRDKFLKQINEEKFDFLYAQLCYILEEFLKAKNIKIDGGIR